MNSEDQKIKEILKEIEDLHLNFEFHHYTLDNGMVIYCHELSSLPFDMLERLSVHGLHGVTAFPTADRPALSLLFLF